MNRGVATGWHWRLGMFACVVVLPFVRFLLQNEYPLYTPEVLSAVALAGGMCLLVAWLLRHELVLGLTAALTITLVSANTVRLLFQPLINLRWRLIISGLLVITAAAIYCLRSRFYKAVVVFCVAALAVDVPQALLPRRPPPPPPAITVQAAPRPVHLLYIIFDEHIGPEGLPKDFVECRRAKAAVENVLLRHNFDYYPYAYSNYSGTFTSIPSVMNRSLLATRDAGVLKNRSGRLTVRANRLVDDYLARGYAVRIYESDTLRLAPDDVDGVTRIAYKANSIGSLTNVPWPWPTKMRHVAGSYVQADSLWSDIWKGLILFGFHMRQERVGPLAIMDVWPRALLEDVRKADQNTLFLAHLLTPHYPYVYHSDGRWRDRNDWETDDLIEPLRQGLYERRQRQYAEQVEWLSVQLDAFLTDLRDSAVYDSMAIVVHGDHGSRIRLDRDCDQVRRKALERSGLELDWGELYDYGAEPDVQELLNRFSTLLGIKRPGAQAPRRDRRRGSVLRFLSEALWGGPPCEMEQSLDSVYLFDVSGRPLPISLAERWDPANLSGMENYEKED